MRTLNLTLEDEEHDFLVDLKNDKNWRDFLLDLAGYKK